MNNTIMLKEIMDQLNLMPLCEEKNEELLDIIKEKIKNFKPESILISARGTSMHSAIFAKYLFERFLGIQTTIANLSVYSVYDAKVDLRKTLVIAISQSGKGKDILASVKKGNECGSLTLAITNSPGSLIEKEAKYNLYNNVGEAVALAATKTYTSTLFLIVKLLYKLTNEETFNLSAKDIVESLKEGKSHHEEIIDLAKKNKDITTSFSFARGHSLSLAMELGLKVKEAAHVFMMSFPTSEFYHGPIIIANENTPSILFAVDKKTNDNVKEMIIDLKKRNVYTLVITNDAHLGELADDAVMIDEENDMLAFFSAVMILQIFACELAFIRGYDPDYNEVVMNVNTI